MYNYFALFLFIIFAGCDNSNPPGDTNSKQVYTQKEIIETMVPILKADGKVYKKFKKIHARKAAEGEEIQTVTKDGLETTNTANEGDFIVRNQTEAAEMYIVPAKKFEDRYVFLEQGQDDFSVYMPKGKVVGVEMNEKLLEQLKLHDEFYLVAPWDEEMVVKKDDYLVSPLDFSEVYRIARKEFFETYQLDE